MEWKVRPCCPPSHSAVKLERGASGDVYPNAQTRRCRWLIWISGSIWHWNSPTWLSQYKHCHRPSALNVTLFTITVTFGSPLRPVYSHLPLVTGQPRQSRTSLNGPMSWEPLNSSLGPPVLSGGLGDSWCPFWPRRLRHLSLCLQFKVHCVLFVSLMSPLILRLHVIWRTISFWNLWESYFNKFEYWRPACPCDRLPCCFFIHETNNCMHTWIDSTQRWPIRAAQ